MKKTIIGFSLAAGLLLAGQALAAAYAPGQAPAGTTITGMPAVSGQMSGLMSGLSQGTLSAQDQMSLYQQIQSARQQMMAVNGSGSNMGYRITSSGMGSLSATMSAPTNAMMVSFGRGQVWLSLMTIITTILVWAVLLLLISVLWHLRKKHKHS